MEQTIREWLLEETNPEVRLRALKEYVGLPDDDEQVVACKQALLQSKICSPTARTTTSRRARRSRTGFTSSRRKGIPTGTVS